MRVLHIIEGDGGGAVTHALTLARQMNGPEVSSSLAFLLDGAAVHEADRLNLDYRLFPKRIPLLDVSLLLKIINHTHRHKIDIIHSHTIRGNFYARLAKLFRRRSVLSITTVHSHKIDELRLRSGVGFKDRLLCRREINTFPLVDHFICVSNKIKQLLMENRIREERITVIENGVDLPDLVRIRETRQAIRKKMSFESDDIVIGTIGRLIPLKNHDLFLEAARKISGVRPNIKFMIVGDGPLFKPLQAMARELGIEDRIRFTGWWNDISSIMPAIDIYAICSRTEGFNLSVLEAMAYEKPVVGTDVKGISDIVESDTGVLVPSADPDSFADGLLDLVDDSQRRSTMARRGRALVEEKYTVDMMIDRTHELYRDLMNGVEAAGAASCSS